MEEFSSRDWTSQNIDSAVWLGKAAFAHSVDTIDGYMECPPDLPPKVIEVLREPSNQDLFRQWSQIASTVQERRTVSRPVEPNYLASTQRSRQLSPPRTASPPHERSFSSSWAKAGALGMFLASLSGSGKAIGVGGAAEPGPAMPPEASAQAVGAPGAWPSPQRAGRASPVEAPGSPERGGPWRVARGFRSLDHAPGPLTTAQMAIINTPRRVTQPPFVTREELGLVAEEGSSEAANLDASALVSQAATWRRHRMAQVDERPGTPGDATASVAGPGSLSQRVRGGREGGRGKGGRSPDGRRRGLEVRGRMFMLAYSFAAALTLCRRTGIGARCKHQGSSSLLGSTLQSSLVVWPAGGVVGGDALPGRLDGGGDGAGHREEPRPQRAASRGAGQAPGPSERQQAREPADAPGRAPEAGAVLHGTQGERGIAMFAIALAKSCKHVVVRQGAGSREMRVT